MKREGTNNMAEYEELDSIIGKMKRAAIDCWMADQSFSPHWGNDMIYAKWGFMLNYYNRPEADGSGGGTGNGVKDSVAEEFEQIRASIDALVSPWTDLPDGSECSTPQSMVSSTSGLLGSSSSGENTDAIATSSGTVEQYLGPIQARFKEPFLDKYYTQFSLVTNGLANACVILEANYAAELEMWPAARTDVATLCDSARGAWEKKSDDAAAASGTLTLTVVAAVAGVVASVVTAGAGTVAAVAALGTIGAAASTAVAAIAADAVISGNTYGDIYSSLSDALDKLDTALREQEDALATMMSDTSDAISSQIADFNLDAFPFGELTAPGGTMSIERSDSNIVSNNLGRIEGSLASAISQLGAPPASNPTPRDSRIGLGFNGTHGQATYLYELVASCLTLTSAEYTRGHLLFDAAVEDFFSSDDAAKERVNALRADEALTTETGY